MLPGKITNLIKKFSQKLLESNLTDAQLNIVQEQIYNLTMKLAEADNIDCVEDGLNLIIQKVELIHKLNSIIDV